MEGIIMQKGINEAEKTIKEDNLRDGIVTRMNNICG